MGFDFICQVSIVLVKVLFLWARHSQEATRYYYVHLNLLSVPARSFLDLSVNPVSQAQDVAGVKWFRTIHILSLVNPELSTGAVIFEPVL